MIPHTAKSEKVAGVALNCGWGRLIFAHTFPDAASVADCLKEEAESKRDIAFYLNDPHIVLSCAPQHLFLDPSHTYRLNFDDYRPAKDAPAAFTIGPVERREELDEVNRIYAAVGMVVIDADAVWERRDNRRFTFFVARAADTGEILGAANGVDHVEAFGDIANGSSLWALAVDPQADYPRIGEALTRGLVEFYRDRGRTHLDLSVLHDNVSAIALYEKLGFKRVPVFAIKRRNLINEKLFIGSPPQEGYNPYAEIIIKEALRRGITVDPIDPPRGFFVLKLGGRHITCRESLSELTTAIALTRCDDKELTRDLLAKAGLPVPAQQRASSSERNHAFLGEHGGVVVKPARGEQGAGITVDIRTPEELDAAVRKAEDVCERVLLEEFREGRDLRIIVINYEVVAAAVRKPARIVGTGAHTVEELIEKQSRRRRAATGGESEIPVDDQTVRCVREAGFEFDDVPADGKKIQVRRTANLHTGGTIHDVTRELHPDLAASAVACARALAIPVVGLDFMVDAPDQPRHIVIEANERPGLANHEPQPTAERFIDFLFPQTSALGT